MKLFGFKFTRRVNLFFYAIHTAHSGLITSTTAASGSLISSGNLKTSEYCGVMVSEIIIGSNKLFNLVGFNITFLTWFNNEIRKEIRLRDRLRKNVLKFGRESDILEYKKQRNKVNNMKKKAKKILKVT
jgi:hypothetical protein